MNSQLNSGLSILLVDDEDHLQEVLGLLLELDGHKVSTAYTGEDALRLAKEKNFNLVITDLRMAGMNGLEVVKAFKEVNSNMHVIMITGFPSPETEEEARRLGVDDYVAKPFHMSKMREVINKVKSKIEAGE